MPRSLESSSALEPADPFEEARETDRMMPTPRTAQPNLPSTPDVQINRGSYSRKKTPLPKLQIGILLYLQLAEPITSTVVYPFVNQLVRETGITGGDESKTGYFSGLIEASFYAMEAMCVMQWGRASDRFGRKPILLSGLCGLTISIVAFGLSRQYWALLVSRCLEGALNGNIGVTKSMMTEITDTTNRADGFSYMPLIWVLGCIIGPLIGGAFSRPADRWPHVFGNGFWERYPYFLPCIAAAAYSISAFVFALCGLRETLGVSLRNAKSLAAEYTEDTVEERPLLAEASQIWTDTLVENQGLKLSEQPDDQGIDHKKTRERVEVFEVVDSPEDEFGEQPSRAYNTLRSILIPRVLYPILNYAFLAFVDQSVVVLFPLMYSTPVSDGGLGFSPLTIGLIQGTSGLVGGVVQIYAFPRLHERLGQKQLYMYGFLFFLPCICAFAVLRHVTRLAGHVTALTWAAIAIQQISYSGTFMTFGCIYMYISDGAPHQSALGLTNGLAQTTASTVRTLAPLTATSLFSLSLQHNLLSGTLVYWILCLFTFGGLIASTYLPSEMHLRH